MSALRPRWTSGRDAELRQLRGRGLTWAQVGEAMGRDTSSVHARWQRIRSEPDNRSEGQSIVGIIGDTHLPFALPEYLGFCKDVFEQHHVTRVVHIGDLADNHAMSYHDPDPDGLSPGDEWGELQRELLRWFAAFPRVEWCLGNHDKIPMRKIFSTGFPAHLLRRNLYDIPEGWTQNESVNIDGVLYTHGLGAGGINGARLLAQRRGVSCVIGHMHRTAGVMYAPTHDGDQRFGLSVGCGCDYKSYSQQYSKDWGRMSLGCGIVRYGVEAMFVPMLKG